MFLSDLHHLVLNHLKHLRLHGILVTPENLEVQSVKNLAVLLDPLEMNLVDL
jgi:hypothetical protein